MCSDAITSWVDFQKSMYSQEFYENVGKRRPYRLYLWSALRKMFNHKSESIRW